MVSCLRSLAQAPAPGNRAESEQILVHRTSEVKPMCDMVAEAMESAGYSKQDRFAVRLALEEAAVNAIKHGNHGDQAKTVRIAFRLDPEQVLLTVEDEGPGFDPQRVADPLSPDNIDRSSGRGLLLMRHYMTWISYNARGNAVTLCKCRTF
jgi:serine/threonine-protein kinase RsbW